MGIYAQILLFIIGFVSGFCLLLAYKVPTILENIGRGDESKAKHIKRIGFALLIIAIIYALVINYYDFPVLYQCNRILINLILGVLLALPVLIHLRFTYLLHSETSKNQLILIGTNGIIIAFIILSEAFVLGMFNAIQTPWMSVELSPHYDAKLKPSIYEVKRELNGVIEHVLKRLDIGCAMLGDRKFAELTINKNEFVEYEESLKNSEKIVYPLMLIIKNAIYIQGLGEHRFRLASILAPVKRSLQRLLDNTHQKNDISALKELKYNIITSYNKLDELSRRYGKNDTIKKLDIPYDNRPDSEGNIGWCGEIKRKDSSYNVYAYDRKKIYEIDEKTFADAAKMPYLYITAAVFMLFDADIDDAIDLLNNRIKRADKNDIAGKDDMNVYYLIANLTQTDARPVKYYIKYNKRLLEIASKKLDKLCKKTDFEFHDALVVRYETARHIAMNNISYSLVRKQSKLTDEDFDLSRKYAEEAHGFAYNSDNSVYIDTLGYVKLVSVLRNGKLSAEQQKHEIQAARILIERAYNIAEERYDAIVQGDKVDSIDESEARQSLMIYEDHLNEALRYEAEINRIE